MLASKGGQLFSGGWEVEEDLRFCGASGGLTEDGDVGVGVEAVDEAGAGRGVDTQAGGACGDAAVGLDFDGGALAEDVGPPGAFGGGAQGGTVFLLREEPCGERGHGQLAMALVGVAVSAEVFEQDVGRGDGGDGLGGAERGEAVLPVLVAALDFAFGLRGRGVAEGDAVKVEGGAELGERIGNGGEKEAVAIDVEAQREAVGEEGAREEVEVSQEALGGIDAGAEAAAAAIIEHIEQRQRRAIGPPAVRGGVELPERADLAALPAADGCPGLALGLGGSEAVGEGKAADGGGIEVEAQAALYLAGGEAVAGGRARAEELAQEWLDLRGPGRGMIAARGARHPGALGARGTGAQIVGMEFVETSAAQAEFGRGGCGTDLSGSKGREHLANKGWSEAVDELLVMFFIAARMGAESGQREFASAWRRSSGVPPLRSGPPPLRRHTECSPLLASHCPGLRARCSPLNATRQRRFATGREGIAARAVSRAGGAAITFFNKFLKSPRMPPNTSLLLQMQ